MYKSHLIKNDFYSTCSMQNTLLGKVQVWEAHMEVN